MSYLRRIAAASSMALVFAGFAAAAPAHATTFDVSGMELNFGNAVDQSILENAEVNDSYLYENVVTVGGTQIDALVTVTAMSDNSLGNYQHEWITQDQIDYVNNDPDFGNPASIDVAGCYSNPDYIAAMDAGEAYDWLGFNAPGSLKGGLEVEEIDGYEGDPLWEPTISTSLQLCDPGYTGLEDGFVDINVEFQVDGSPVTLTNVAIHATDLDWGQQLTFWSPAPTTFEVSGASSLVTIDDNSVSDDSVTFNGSPDGSIDGQEDNYVGEVTYASVSEFDYTFRLNDASSGSVQLAFKSYFHPADLASTGVDAAPAAGLGLGILGLGAGIVVARRVRRNRA